MLRRDGRRLVLQGATVLQVRNPHDFFADYLDEREMYLHVDRLIALLDDLAGALEPGSRGLVPLYATLVAEGIVKDPREVALLEAWLEAVG